MANSMVTISRKLCRALLWQPKVFPSSSKPFFSSAHLPSSSSSSSSFFGEKKMNELFEDHSGHGVVSEPEYEGEEQQPSNASSSSLKGEATQRQPPWRTGSTMAILVGMVGPSPLQKSLKNVMKLTLLTVGTGGIRSNRRPLENEDPREYANRSDVLRHRVVVYQRNSGDLIMKIVEPGSIVYLEGNLETKVFLDLMTGLVCHIREVAIRQNGQGWVGNVRVPNRRVRKLVNAHSI